MTIEEMREVCAKIAEDEAAGWTAHMRRAERRGQHADATYHRGAAAAASAIAKMIRTAEVKSGNDR